MRDTAYDNSSAAIPWDDNVASMVNSISTLLRKSLHDDVHDTAVSAASQIATL